jgi:hypothetical protein
LVVRLGPPIPAPDPKLDSLFVYKKKPAKIVNPVRAGSKGKKMRVVVSGTDFDAGAELLINSNPVELQSSGPTEIVGKLTNQLVAAPGELNIRVRNSTGKLSNVLKLFVVQ